MRHIGYWLFLMVRLVVRAVIDALEYERVEEIEHRYHVEFMKADRLEVGLDAYLSDPRLEPFERWAEEAGL